MIAHRIIRKFFKTLKEAEDYQNGLYEKYHSVNLTDFPHLSEKGTYVWRVSGKIR